MTSNPVCLSDEEAASMPSGDDPTAGGRPYAVALYVDRATQQWVVRDPRGIFWLVSADENCWQHRRPFQLMEDTDLEPVPGHYQYLFNLPF
jgi:hypothetical protein